MQLQASNAQQELVTAASHGSDQSSRGIEKAARPRPRGNVFSRLSSSPTVLEDALAPSGTCPQPARYPPPHVGSWPDTHGATAPHVAQVGQCHQAMAQQSPFKMAAESPFGAEDDADAEGPTRAMHAPALGLPPGISWEAAGMQADEGMLSSAPSAASEEFHDASEGLGSEASSTTSPWQARTPTQQISSRHPSHATSATMQEGANQSLDGQILLGPRDAQEVGLPLSTADGRDWSPSPNGTPMLSAETLGEHASQAANAAQLESLQASPDPDVADLVSRFQLDLAQQQEPTPEGLLSSGQAVEGARPASDGAPASDWDALDEQDIGKSFEDDLIPGHGAHGPEECDEPHEVYDRGGGASRQALDTDADRLSEAGRGNAQHGQRQGASMGTLAYLGSWASEGPSEDAEEAADVGTLQSSASHALQERPSSDGGRPFIGTPQRTTQVRCI